MQSSPIIITDRTIDLARARLNALPVDGTFEVVMRPYKRKRRDEANALYWVRLAEISEQAFIANKQFAPEVWAEYLKGKFLPDVYTEGETLDGYHKYIETPDGTTRMVGSTTRLTTRGFANYLTQVEAYGASLGVHFSAFQGE